MSFLEEVGKQITNALRSGDVKQQCTSCGRTVKASDAVCPHCQVRFSRSSIVTEGDAVTDAAAVAGVSLLFLGFAFLPSFPLAYLICAIVFGLLIFGPLSLIVYLLGYPHNEPPFWYFVIAVPAGLVFFVAILALAIVLTVIIGKFFSDPSVITHQKLRNACVYLLTLYIVGIYGYGGWCLFENWIFSTKGWTEIIGQKTVLNKL